MDGVSLPNITMKDTEKKACLTFEAVNRVYAKLYSEDYTERIFELMDTPELLLKELRRIGHEYGIDHCNGSFLDVSHIDWLYAIETVEDYAG